MESSLLAQRLRGQSAPLGEPCPLSGFWWPFSTSNRRPCAKLPPVPSAKRSNIGNMGNMDEQARPGRQAYGRAPVLPPNAPGLQERGSIMDGLREFLEDL